jgi:hypothetical protein
MGKSKPANPSGGSKAAVDATTAGCAKTGPPGAASHGATASDACSGKGFADPDVIADFVKDFKSDVAKDWDKLTADERFAAVKKLQEKQFELLGLPKPTIDRSSDSAAGWDNPVTLFGQANAGPWSMTFNGNLFTKSPLTEHDKKELAKTMMHEGRHLEQYYKTAQYRASKGDSASDIRTKDTPTHKPIDLPQSVVDDAAKKKLPEKKPGASTGGAADDCPNYKNAKEWNDAKWGKGALSQYRAGVAYADRPLEKDAWGLEPTIDAKW